MGYACPVCGDPQADGRHLANHLAFTAMLGDDPHAEWLDERAPGWTEADPADLAATVTDDAEETDYPQVFEDTTEGDGHGHDRDHRHGHAGDPTDVLDGVPGDVASLESVDDTTERDTEDVLAEARELTRRRRANAAGDGGDGADDDRDDESADDDRGGENADADGGTGDGTQ